MPYPTENKERNLIRKKGFKRYAVIFSWPQKEDRTAAEKLLEFHLTLDRDHNIQHARGLYLNGKYRMIVTGLVKDYTEFTQLCEMVTYGTQIDYEISEAIDIHSLAAHAKKLLKGGSEKSRGGK
jgi:hypothetical protein